MNLTKIIYQHHFKDKYSFRNITKAKKNIWKKLSVRSGINLNTIVIKCVSEKWNSRFIKGKMCVHRLDAVLKKNYETYLANDGLKWK